MCSESQSDYHQDIDKKRPKESKENRKRETNAAAVHLRTAVRGSVSEPSL